MISDEEEVESFEITDYDLESELNPGLRKRQTKEQAIYGQHLMMKRKEPINEGPKYGSPLTLSQWDLLVEDYLNRKKNQEKVQLFRWCVW